MSSSLQLLTLILLLLPQLLSASSPITIHDIFNSDDLNAFFGGLRDYLLSGGDPNAKLQGETMIELIISNIDDPFKVDVVSRLLEFGADANTQTVDGFSLLQLSVSLRHPGLIDLLLRNGAVLEVPEDSEPPLPGSVLPIIMACRDPLNANHESFLKLLSYTPPNSHTLNQLFHHLFLDEGILQNSQLRKDLLGFAYDANSFFNEFYNQLTISISEFNIPENEVNLATDGIFDILRDMFTRLHQVDMSAYNALVCSGLKMHFRFGPEVIRNAQDCLSHSSFELVSDTPLTPLSPHFIDTPHGPLARTSLMIAVILGNQEAVKTLIQAGSDIAAVDTGLSNSLIHAARKGHADILHILVAAIESRPDALAIINHKDRFGRTALSTALGLGHIKCSGILEYKGTRIHEDTGASVFYPSSPITANVASLAFRVFNP